MRRHDKASAADTPQRQTAGFGPVLRGAFATRGASCDGDGRGAPRAGRLLCLSLLAALAASLLAASPAAAVKTHAFKEVFGSAAQPTFTSAFDVALHQASGDVYVMDAGSPPSIKRYNADGTPDNFSALGTNVIDGIGTGSGDDKTPVNGLAFAAPTESQLAVDNSGGATDGNIYVTQESPNAIYIFSSSGVYLGQLDKAGATSLTEACGVAVDPSGAVYVGDYEDGIKKFVPTANPPVNTDHVATFTAAPFTCPIAAGAGSTAGYIFPLEWSSRIRKVNSTTGAVQYVVGGNGYTTVAVDPGTGHVYGMIGSKVEEFDASGVSATKVVGWSLASEGRGIDVNGASGDVYTSRAGYNKLDVFGPLADEPPEIKGVWVSDVTTTEAKLNARVNPKSLSTTYKFEYGTTVAYGSSTEEKFLGSDSTEHVVAELLEGLEPGTTYHYRLALTSSVGNTYSKDATITTQEIPPPITSCPNQAFRVGPGVHLPDCRAYELVTPIEKGGADITSACNNECTHTAFYQLAPDGNRFTYSSFKSFGDQPSGQYSNQYIASRGSGGWTSHGINAPQGTTIFDPQFNAFIELETRWAAFSPDLSSGWLVDYNKEPLTPDGLPDHINIYRRDNLADTYETVIVNPPLGPAEPILGPSFAEPAEVQGVSEDGSHVVFAAHAALTSDANPGTNRQLYDFSAGELHLVSVLPDDTAVTQNSNAGFFKWHFAGGPRVSQRAHAVSDDGSRIFFNVNIGAFEERLYVRIDGQETVLISPESAHFLRASRDGSKVLYAIGTPSNGNAGILLYDVDAETTTPIANSAYGIAGASDDLSYVYFVSKASLDAGAVAGEPNLYLSHAGSIDHIATVPASEALATSTAGFGIAHYEPIRHASRVTPDGRHVVFQTTASVTGYDNVDALNGKSDVEVYVYDADSGELICASCNPSGARPVGKALPRSWSTGGANPTSFWAAAWIPTEEKSTVTAKPLSDDGNRLFFNSFDALVGRDVNGIQDVYEWKAPGFAGCEKANGCVNLISSGQSSEKSEFIEATGDGSEVFFTTSSSLLPQDPGLVDIYAARIEGGLPMPPPPPVPCVGDACQPVPAPPNDPTPASAGFSGAGDPTLAPRRPYCRKLGARKGGKASKKARRQALRRCRRAQRRAAR